MGAPNCTRSLRVIEPVGCCRLPFHRQRYPALDPHLPARFPNFADTNIQRDQGIPSPSQKEHETLIFLYFKKMNATFLDDWKTVCLKGNALRRVAESGDH
jgi:hypothetical protein